MNAGRIRGAVLAQILAQALTGWTLLAHAAHWPDVSVLALISLLAAGVVPFRHDGSFKDRATGNFGAAVVVAGFLWWELIMGGFDSIFGGMGFQLGMEGMLMLGATVLFTVAGALFWTMRENGDLG